MDIMSRKEVVWYIRMQSNDMIKPLAFLNKEIKREIYLKDGKVMYVRNEVVNWLDNKMRVETELRRQQTLKFIKDKNIKPERFCWNCGKDVYMALGLRRGPHNLVVMWFCDKKCQNEYETKLNEKRDMFGRKADTILQLHSQTPIIMNDPEALGSDFIRDFIGLNCKEKPSQEI